MKTSSNFLGNALRIIKRYRSYDSEATFNGKVLVIPLGSYVHWDDKDKLENIGVSVENGVCKIYLT